MARPVKYHTSITVRGPFFTSDPAKTLQQNVHTMMLAIAKAGQRDVRQQLGPGSGERAPIKLLGDHVVNHVYGELRRYPSGAPFTMRIIVRNRRFTKPEGISLMAAASFLEGTIHAFRKTRGRIMRAREINTEELLKGIK